MNMRPGRLFALPWLGWLLWPVPGAGVPGVRCAVAGVGGGVQGRVGSVEGVEQGVQRLVAEGPRLAGWRKCPCACGRE